MSLVPPASGCLRHLPALALSIGLALPARPAEAGTAELQPEVTLATAGAANPWLLPGPLETDLWLMVLPGLTGRWWTPRVGLSLGYDFSLQRYVDADLTGRIHEGAASAWWRPARRWRLEVDAGVADTAYDTPGPSVTEGTLPLLATRSTAWTGGAQLGWSSDRTELWAAYGIVHRHSTGEFATVGESPEAVDETFHEGVVAVRWRAAPGVWLGAMPLVQVRAASVAALSYAGLGARLSAEGRLWAGASLGVYVRAQGNRFDDRTDVYARVGIDLEQQVGAWLLLGLRHAYTANGSRDPLWDADRHVLLATADVRLPALRWE